MGDVVPMPERATFEDFWKLCYRKVDKALARSKWTAITSERGLETRIRDRETGELVSVHLQATPEEIIAGLNAYNKTLYSPTSFERLVEDRYIVHPATFLNRGRWMDYE